MILVLVFTLLSSTNVLPWLPSCTVYWLAVSLVYLPPPSACGVCLFVHHCTRPTSDWQGVR